MNRKRVLRWLRRFVVTLLALVVVAIGVVLIVLHTAWGRDYLRGKIESALVAQFPGGAHVGELDGSVLGEVVVHDVVINGTDGKPQYSVKTLRVNLALLPLVHKTARIDSLVAEDVAIAIHKRPPPPPKPPAPPSEPSWSVELPHLEVHGGNVVIEGAEPIHIDRVELAGDLRIPAGEPISGWASATATWRERGAPITAAVVAKIDRGTFEVPVAAGSVGDVRLSAAAVAIDGDRVAGVFTARGSPAAVSALLPEVELPGDAEVVVDAQPGAPIRVIATQGDATLHGAVRIDPARKRLTASAVGTAFALESFTKGKVAGMGVGIAAGELAWEHMDVRGSALVVGMVDGKSGGTIGVSGELVGDHGGMVVFGAAPGNTHLRASAELTRKPGELAIANAAVVAATSDAKAASPLSPATGSLSANLDVAGTVRPVLDLTIKGTIGGRRVRYTAEGEDLAASSVAVTIRSATHVPHGPIVDGRVETAGIVRNGNAIGAVTIDGKNTVDGKLELAIHARPAAAKLRADLRASVHDGWLALVRKQPGAKLVADLGDNAIAADSGVAFKGRGGTITVDDKLVSVRDFMSRSGTGGKVTVSADFHRDTLDVDAKLDATKIATSIVDPEYRGTASGNAELHRKGGKWSGKATLNGRQLARAPDQPAFDADVNARLDGRRVQLDAGANNMMLGGATVAIDVTGPRDVFDAVAWRKVGRSDVRSVKLTAKAVDLGGIGHVFAGNDKLSGVADGELAIAPDGVRGSIRVHGVHAKPAGDADVIVTIDPGERGELAAKAKLALAGVGADATARVALPDRLFDPEAWRTAGRAMLRDGTVELADTAFDQKLLARFGLDQPIRGHASAKITITAAASSVRIAADVRDVQGGALVKPVTVHLEAVADGHGTCADAEVTSVRGKGKSGAVTAARCAGFTGVAGSPEMLDLLAIHGELPLSIDRWFATDLPRLLVTPVTGTITLPSTSVPDMLAVVGRRDATAGVIDGAVAVQGTVGTPTIPPSTLTVHGLEVNPGTSATPPRLDLLTITARWGGVSGQLDAKGTESNGGTLTAHAEGRLTAPELATSWLQVDKFGIAPVAVFLPGPLVGAAGKLDGRIDLRGLDPRTGDLSGRLTLSEARIPMSAKIGTVRAATLGLTIGNRKITAKLDGKLAGGTVHLDGDLRLAGIVPDHVDATAQLRRISPIGAIEPVIDADVHAALTRSGSKWTGPIDIRHGKVVVPESRGKNLLAVGQPSDLVIGEAKPISELKLEREAPRDPWIVADVDLHSTEVESEIFRGAIGGQFKLLVGDTVALDGSISTERGDVEILGRRYRIEHAVADFPSSLDPNLDIEVIHEFPEVELVVDVKSSLSAFIASPLGIVQTRTEPAIYTADQRLGFLLGGEPGGDPSSQSRDAAAAAGASVFSQFAQRYVQRFLPFKIPLTISYQPATATSSASYTGGQWVTDKLFWGIRRHTEQRLDNSENLTEGTVEYYLGKRWLLEGNGGDRGIFGGDILWRKRY